MRQHRQRRQRVRRKLCAQLVRDYSSRRRADAKRMEKFDAGLSQEELLRWQAWTEEWFRYIARRARYDPKT